MNMTSKIEFGGTDPKAQFEYALKISGVVGTVGIIAMRTGDGWMESDGVIGHAKTWDEAVTLLHDAGYKLLRVGGDISAYAGEEQGEPQCAAVLIVTVLP